LIMASQVFLFIATSHGKTFGVVAQPASMVRPVRTAQSSHSQRSHQ
jgi:hypothetical protein